MYTTGSEDASMSVLVLSINTFLMSKENPGNFVEGAVRCITGV